MTVCAGFSGLRRLIRGSRWAPAVCGWFVFEAQRYMGTGDAGKKSGAQRVPIQVAGHMVFPVLCGVLLQVGQRKVRWVMRCEARRRGLCIGQCIVFAPLFAWSRARRRLHGSAAASLGEPGTRLPGWPGPRCAPAMGHVEGGGRRRRPATRDRLADARF